MSATLQMFTIYDHPDDYPSGFMVREWAISAGGMTPLRAWRVDDLEAARDLLPRRDLIRIARAEQDDPVIVESWA